MTIKSDIYTLGPAGDFEVNFFDARNDRLKRFEQIRDTFREVLTEPGTDIKLKNVYWPGSHLKTYYLEISYADEESKLSFTLKYSREYIKEIIHENLR